MNTGTTKQSWGKAFDANDLTPTPSHAAGTPAHHTPVAQCDGTDEGYTLMEMLMVVVMLGILSAAVLLAVTGLSTQAADTGCHADLHQLHVSTEAYFAQTGARTLAATGTDHDRFERTLVDGGFLRSPSTFHDLDAAGVVIPEENSPC